MMDVLTQIVVWLNTAANALGQAFMFIGFMPGWLSATIIAIVSGMAMLLAFKYTSNQRAIKRARQEIRANLLAVKLFHDSLLVGFRAQGRVLLAAVRLLLLAIVPILAMLVPMSLLLLVSPALWYQSRPLRIGEEAVITLKLRGDAEVPFPAITLEPNDSIEDTHGPVRVYSQREICWNVRALKDGYHDLVFHIDGGLAAKELAIGDHLMRVSTRRPDWVWTDALLHPREPPFGPESPVASIEIQYSTRSSWTSAPVTGSGIGLRVSLVTGFCCRGLFKVNL